MEQLELEKFKISQENKIARCKERLSNLMDELSEELKSCQHPDRALVKKRDYYCGSYYDTAYTDEWVECTICETKSEISRTSHGYYG